MKAIRAAALLLLILPLLACLSSCDYLLGDSYPAYTQRMGAWIDLDDAAKAASGGSPIQDVGRINYLESSGSSAVFVEYRTKDGFHRLLSLDGESLAAPVGYLLGNSFAEVGLAASGHYVFFSSSGWVALRPDSRAVDGSYSAALSPLSVYSYSALVNEAGSNYFFFLMGNANQNIDLYDAAFTLVGVRPWLNIPIGPSVSLWDNVSIGQGGGYYCFLFRIYNTNDFRAFRTPSIGAMPAWTSLFDDPAVPSGYKSAAFSADQSRVWITADGPVTATNDNNGLVFSLRKFGASGSTSTYTLKDESSATFSFEPSGRYWFMYEKSSGRLYKMRTWW